MQIEHLAEHVDVVPTLALWAKNQWGSMFPEETYATILSEFGARTIYHHIPETFVAVENAKPVGMASLVEDDMDTRRDLSPWLASVYVLPEFRNRGIGAALVQTVMREAEKLGIKTLYLFTPDKMDFYRQLGWQDFEQTEYRGELVTIMVCFTQQI